MRNAAIADVRHSVPCSVPLAVWGTLPGFRQLCMQIGSGSGCEEPEHAPEDQAMADGRRTRPSSKPVPHSGHRAQPGLAQAGPTRH